ncbi:ABC transporter substrate-binding protein, partial [Eubacteriales bacterium OttesenSCG-928-A19]|nr:ABC transporter substrate-binding protein [Eubacteriales bacterium OttesenSCG-928-A19]
MRKFLCLVLTAALCLGGSFALADAASNLEAAEAAAAMTYDELLEAAKAEGQVYSVGMPDEWANWKDLWAHIDSLGVKTFDTDMSSAEELAQFALQGKANADIGDIGIAMTGVAVEQDLLLPFKTSYWDSIPDWAKEPDGLWIEAYTCTTAFVTDKQNVENPPTSWADVIAGDYKVCIGDVEKAAQAYYGVLACNVALGGDETDLTPAIEAFQKMAEDGRLNTSNPYVSNMENGEIDVAIVWDFNALGYRDEVDTERFDVTIPSDGAVQSGYASVINKYANNPYAAMLVREIILSDVGQNFLALGYARPIREDVELSEEAQARVLDAALYENTYKIQDLAVW